MDYTEDYYAILGVSRDATQEQIKTAYRSLCKVHHPDVGGDAAMMQLLNKAYVTLSDEILRGKYDAEYSARSNTPPPGTVKAHIINRFGQTSEEYIPINSLKFDIAQYRDENDEIYIYKTQKMNSVIKRTLWYSMYFYHNDPDTIVTCYVYDPKRGIYTAPCPISKIPYDELDRINDDGQLFVICADDDIKFCSSLSELETEQKNDKKSSVFFVLILIGVLLISVVVGSILEGASSISDILNHSSDNAYKDIDFVEQPVPKHGTEEYYYDEYYYYTSDISFNTKNTTSKYCYIKAIDADTNEMVQTLFIHCGTKCTMTLPVGDYKLYYAAGDTWYGEKNLFGYSGAYLRCDSLFELTTQYGYTVTLYTVTDGNMETDPISFKEFAELGE